MPEHLKNTPNTKEFQKYLQTFVKSKERQHRRKVIQEIAASVALMMAG